MSEIAVAYSRTVASVWAEIGEFVTVRKYQAEDSVIRCSSQELRIEQAEQVRAELARAMEIARALDADLLKAVKK